MNRLASGVAVAAVCGFLAACGGAGDSGGTFTATNSAHRQRLDRRLRHMQRELTAERDRVREKMHAAHRRGHAKAAAVATPSTSGEPSAGAATSASRGEGLRGAVIAIDPGHNGGNGAHPGAIDKPVVAYADGQTKACDTTGTETNDGRLTESLFNLYVAEDLAAKLRARGARVVMTRTTNGGIGPCINERAAIGNRAHADAAISIHADGAEAAGDHGFDVIYPQIDELVRPAVAGPSRRLAVKVRDALAGGGIPTANYVGSNGLDARDDLGGLNLSTVPKVFAELGNMRSASEAAKLESTAYRARLAAALATGIEQFLSAAHRQPLRG
jgi:N-acetylmuramoyl-L-alanine amidase